MTRENETGQEQKKIQKNKTQKDKRLDDKFIIIIINTGKGKKTNIKQTIQESNTRPEPLIIVFLLSYYYY